MIILIAGIITFSLIIFVMLCGVYAYFTEAIDAAFLEVPVFIIIFMWLVIGLIYLINGL